LVAVSPLSIPWNILVSGDISRTPDSSWNRDVSHLLRPNVNCFTDWPSSAIWFGRSGLPQADAVETQFRL
jgi:hypothetical protein